MSKPKDLRQEVMVEFQDFWKESFQTFHGRPVKPTRYEDLHPSSFPYCGLRDGYNRAKDGLPTVQEMDLNGFIYTSVGTVVHEQLQNLVGRIKKTHRVKHRLQILGNWKCANRRCKGRRYLCEYKRCPKCKGEMFYEELGISWRAIEGHIDKVLRIGKYLIILDYKTTSVKAINEHKYRGGQKFPYKSNVSQIQCYAALFEKVYHKHFLKGGLFEGCEVVGSLLVYVARDAPGYQREIVWLSSDPKTKMKHYQLAVRDSKAFKIAKKVRELEDFEPLLKLKACKSHEQYMEDMHSQYDECPLHKVCFDRKKLFKKLGKAIAALKKREQST